MEDVVREAQTMLANGIREIQIIAQDTTRYGTDLYGKPYLFELLEQIENIGSISIPRSNKEFHEK